MNVVDMARARLGPFFSQLRRSGLSPAQRAQVVQKIMEDIEPGFSRTLSQRAVIYARTEGSLEAGLERALAELVVGAAAAHAPDMSGLGTNGDAPAAPTPPMWQQGLNAGLDALGRLGQAAMGIATGVITLQNARTTTRAEAEVLRSGLPTAQQLANQATGGQPQIVVQAPESGGIGTTGLLIGGGVLVVLLVGGMFFMSQRKGG